MSSDVGAPQINPQQSDFLDRLHAEKLATQARRGSLISRKLTWVTGLAAAGWLRFGDSLNLWPLLLLVPFVAVLFDLYILGENYGVKRMGVFVRDRCKDSKDSEWERFLLGKRDIFSSYALPVGSCVVLVASAFGLFAHDIISTVDSRLYVKIGRAHV